MAETGDSNPLVALPNTSKNTPGKKEHIIKVVDKMALDTVRGHEPKSNILGELHSPHSDRKKGISLFERPLRKNRGYFSIWNAFREAGLPVVPTVRLTNQESLIMTDVTADGSKLYGKAFARELDKEDTSETYQLTQQDEYFLELTDEDNIEDITNQAIAFADIATKHNFRLPWDDAFELLVKPDGSWSLVMLDLTYASTDWANRATDSTPLSQINREDAEYFLNELKKIREKLLSL